MAKVGNVSPTGGSDDAIKAAVMGDLTPNLTLGQLSAAALGGSDNDLIVVIDLPGRTVKVKPAADAAKINADNAVTKFTIDDATKKVATWTGDEGEIATVANATAKPSRSLAALISAIEDYVATNDYFLDTVGVVVDQVNEKVLVYENQSDIWDTTPSASLAEFSDIVETSSGAPHGPFE